MLVRGWNIPARLWNKTDTKPNITDAMTITTKPLQDRQRALVLRNVALLEQGIAMLEGMTDAAYSQPHASMQGVGGHLRHILEFYECFLDAVDSAHIDFDFRKRDESVEWLREIAVIRATQIAERLLSHPALRGDSAVWVRVDDCRPGECQDPFLLSTVGRELQVLASHTTHHFALIGLILGARQVSVQENFGVAPFALRHRSEHRKIEAA